MPPLVLDCQRRRSTAVWLLRRDLGDLVALYPEAGHQALLSEHKGVDIVLHRAGRGGLRHALVDQDDAWADADLETRLQSQVVNTPARPAEVAEAYRKALADRGEEPTAANVMAAVSTDKMFRLHSIEVAEAQAEDKAKEVLAELERRKSEIEAKANANLDKAVAYVLERVIGRA